MRRTGLAGVAVGPEARPAVAAPPPPAVAPASSPAAAMDAPDPDVLLAGSTYYAYTTGTTWGNHIGVLESTSPDSGYHTITGKTYGSTAVGPLPAWEENNTQTSPGVFYYAGHYVMFYDATDTAAGYNCISVAVSATPQGPFEDNSTAPLICQTNLGGSVDPQPFVDPATGQAWVDWKSNDGSASGSAYLWAARLGSDGTSLASSPVQLLAQNEVSYPWETTVENPDMVDVGGTYYLFFAAGNWQSSNYSEGYAVCSGPSGPCSQPDSSPILTSYGSVAGPGAGNVFTDTSGQTWISYAAWTSGCTSYQCGGKRQLYVGQVSFAAPAPAGPVCSRTLPAGSVVAMAATPNGGGYWMADSAGDIATCGNAGYFGSAGGAPLARPIVGMAGTPDAGGYWLVASDGGIFTYGDASFHGSAGAIHLARPIVGMASTPEGGGYWLVASDGGIFTYGDASFHGSAGAIALARPIVGMAATPDGGGYWLVASDGGIFTYGDARFFGSAGAEQLARPIVGMSSMPDAGGYRFCASDGGIFTYGDAGFYGSAA
ncbi:MAG TPA: family 43 glycosylhydrolase [Acidimicrobiales bacterium]|nr:family 43 glycosylhydrolase [Acidimicrobiales bacterium]